MPAFAPAAAAGLRPACRVGKPTSIPASSASGRQRSSHSTGSASQARTNAARIGNVGNSGPLSASFSTSLG